MQSRSIGIRLICVSALVGTAFALVGCGPDGWAAGGPQRASSSGEGGGSVNPFDPPALPDSFEASKAKLTVAQLPNDPPAPNRPTSRPAVVPDAARRRIEEARRLFAEQRYTETIVEAEKSLRYEPNLADGHRLIALASLLSGNESRARLSAERALTIAPDSLACHYVLARYAEKAGKKDEALRAYRSALKSDASPEDRSYRALTQYYLGGLLFEEGYYAAAAEQIESFEETLAAMAERVADNPELASVARVHRGKAALMAARARGYLGQYGAAADALKRVAARLAEDVEIRAEYIRMLVRAKRSNEAADEAARLLADSQGNSVSVQLLVAVYAASGHPDRAVAAIKSVVAKQPENVELWLVYVDTLWKAGKTKEAFHAARDLLSRHPDSSAARWKLIELHEARQDWAGWATQLAEYLAAEPEQASRVARQLQKIPVASVSPLLETLQAAGPTASAPTGTLESARDVVHGALLERVDKLDEARVRYDAAIARTPEFMPAALAAGELYLSRCRWKDAIAVLESTQKGRDKPSVQIEMLLARACEGLDLAADAREHYVKAIRLDRTNARAMVSLARLHERMSAAFLSQQQYQEAQQALDAARQQYQEAIAADAAYMPAREGLLHLLLAQLGGRSMGREQQSTLNRALSELGEMQKLAAQDPATQRAAAYVQFLFSRDEKQYRATLEKLLTHYPAEQQTRERLFQQLLEAREYEPALKVARDMIHQDRCSAAGHESLATIELRLLKFDEAARQFDRMIEMYPNREQWLDEHAKLLSLIQRYDGAISIYERMLVLEGIKGKPDRELVVRDKMAQVYRRAGQYDRINELIETWLADAAEERYRHRYRGMLLQTDLVAENYDRYLSRCRQWLESAPNSPELEKLLILGLLRADRNDEAVTRALGWLSQKPDEERLDWFGDVLQAAHRHVGAIDIARGLLAATEKAEQKRARLGAVAMLFVSAKRYDPAIVALRQLITQTENTLPEETTSPLDRFRATYGLKKLLASVYVQADRPEEATRYLNKMLNDLNEIIQVALSRLEQQRQKLEESANSDEDKKKLALEFERARTLIEADANPRRADILRQMYMAYQRQGQIEVAEQRLREALALAPDDPGICNDLGYSYADTGKQLQEAMRLTALAVGDEPTTAAYLDSYGWALYKLGRFEEATQWLGWGAGLEGGEDSVIHDHLGDAQWRTGRKETAIQSWKRALKIYHQEVKEGQSTPEKDLPDRVRRKLDAVAAQKDPPIASTGSRPAE